MTTADDRRTDPITCDDDGWLSQGYEAHLAHLAYLAEGGGRAGGQESARVLAQAQPTAIRPVAVAPAEADPEWVVFDPDAAGGFRALTDDEHTRFINAARGDSGPDTTGETADGRQTPGEPARTTEYWPDRPFLSPDEVERQEQLTRWHQDDQTVLDDGAGWSR